MTIRFTTSFVNNKRFARRWLVTVANKRNELLINRLAGLASKAYMIIDRVGC